MKDGSCEICWRERRYPRVGAANCTEDADDQLSHGEQCYRIGYIREKARADKLGADMREVLCTIQDAAYGAEHEGAFWCEQEGIYTKHLALLAALLETK